MKYYAHIDTSGKIQGWYNSKIHTEIPEPNVDVTEDVWQKALDKNANFYDQNTGEFLVKDFRTKIQKEEDAQRDARARRDAALQEVLWLVDRHNQELALQLETTLTPEQYLELLTYVQALRDYPQQKDYHEQDLPKKPKFAET